MKPLLAVGRVPVAVLDVEPLQRPVVQLPAQRQDALAVFRVHLLHPELHGPEAGLPLGRNAAEVAEAVVEEDGTAAKSTS